MFTPIHQALGLEPGELSVELIERAIEAGVQETASLDWKSDFYDSRKPGWEDEAAKDIAAMANSGGGWIVFGVVEDEETSAALEMKPIRWNSREQQRILRTAYAHIGPPVLGLEFFDFPRGDGYIVMMRVPDSREAPHFARKGNDAFVAPRRNGPHTAFMSDREIERGFRERFQQRDDDEQKLQLLYERTGKVMNPIEGVCLVVVAVPNEPSLNQEFSEETASRFTGSDLNAAFVRSDSVSKVIRLENGQLRKGMRQWIIRGYDSDQFTYRKFLSDNGTVACTYRLGATINNEQARPYYPVGQPNHCVSSHIESVMIDFFCLLRAFAIERQINAGFHLCVGLVGNPEEPIYIRTTGYRGNYLLGEDYSEPIFSFQPVIAVIDPVAPLDEVIRVAIDVVRDIINQGGIKYLKVMVESNDM